MLYILSMIKSTYYIFWPQEVRSIFTPLSLNIDIFLCESISRQKLFLTLLAKIKLKTFLDTNSYHFIKSAGFFSQFLAISVWRIQRRNFRIRFRFFLYLCFLGVSKLHFIQVCGLTITLRRSIIPIQHYRKIGFGSSL